MRLDRIKIAGFKSFVDPTTIHLTSNLMGVVGPNGCGKSNIIDAVRWVMGESSAKHLRGESMADVIFNGSSSRKPVGHATIELIFDNTDGTLTGQFANYNEVSIKRQVSRDGQSQYSLNNTRCRRKDVTDIFLGTGLGPRSYSIIEQGMISRLIEAKPEELRVFLEEAAGISKYKERRRETENRIRHTRDNLSRLNDLIEEVDKQIEKLRRQAKVAEKYKDYKKDERRLQAELLALKLRRQELESESHVRQTQERETALEAARAQQQSIETALEKDRDQHIEATDQFNVVQGRYYAIGGEIARLEQSIQHNKELRHRQENDLKEAEQHTGELSEHIQADKQIQKNLQAELQELEPQQTESEQSNQQAQQALTEAEQAMQAWHQQWDAFTSRASEVSETAQVEKTRIEHMERSIVKLQGLMEGQQDELKHISDSDLEGKIDEVVQHEQTLASQQQDMQSSLQGLTRQLDELREQYRQRGDQLNETQELQQTEKGRLTSLQALQQAALGKADDRLNQWLQDQGLWEVPRLAQSLQVESGWERALETVLGLNLEALCVNGLNEMMDVLSRLDDGALAIFDTATETAATRSADAGKQSLADKVQAPWDMGPLLDGIYTADNIQQAMSMRGGLQAGESVILPDGIWIGSNWLHIARGEDQTTGVLEREQEIKQLDERVKARTAELISLNESQQSDRELIRNREDEREQAQAKMNDVHRQHAQCQAELDNLRHRNEQQKQRVEKLQNEVREHDQQLQQEGETLKAARHELNMALEQINTFANERDQLNEQRSSLQGRLDETRQAARQAGEHAHQVSLDIQTRNSQLESIRQNLVRMESQLETLASRQREIQEALESGMDPIQVMETELEKNLAQRVEVETELADARKALEDVDEAVRQHEQQRSEAEQQVQVIREQLEQERLQLREYEVRRTTLQEQLDETGFDKDGLLQQLEEQASVEEWVEKVEQMARRIQRLGSINLAAIDEFAEQSERKVYLDSQHADITEALTTLENAIHKIDRETRTRFKETFDKVNNGLKEKFPKVFGGGHAYLELTGEDLLDTGVTVMARPPGKRNSTIHMLSGGEKALTAVALVFSIFDLNPAPFCLLDEVDAPLDDANVGRFCELVSTMAEQVQFLFITHNKVTMAMANQLMGVTMHEPGVSRLVSVDVDEAVELAAV